MEEAASRPEQVAQMEACIDRNKQVRQLRETYLRLKNLHAQREETDTHPSSVVYLEALNEACQKIGQQGGAAMAKGNVSSGTHTQQQMNHHANQGNPNNSANRAANNNRSNQLNPNNSAYQGKK